MDQAGACPLWLAMLRQVPFLETLPPRELKDFAGQVRRRHLKRGEYLFFEDEPTTMFYIVRAGRLKLLKLTASGRELIVHMAGPGDQVGVADCLGDRYTTTAQAQAAAIVLGFPATALRELARDNPAVAWKLLLLLREQLIEAQNQITAMATERVEQRLARALLRLGERSTRRAEGRITIDPPLSRYDLAQLCGTTTETVSRIISNWQRTGLVEAGRERIVLVDLEELARIAEASLAGLQVVRIDS